MSKHTRGPWIPSGYGFNVLTGDSMHSIASVDAPWRPDDNERARERIANAHLIAAAPDLLAACEAALIWLDSAPIHYENGVEHNGMDEGDILGTRGHVRITDQLTTAITKARGAA